MMHSPVFYINHLVIEIHGFCRRNNEKTIEDYGNGALSCVGILYNTVVT